MTLLEVVVTVGVLALAAALVMPRLPDRGALALDAAAAELRDALGFARERAILGGARWRLVVDVDAGRWALGRPAAGGGLDRVPGPFADPVTLPREVRVVTVRAGATDVRTGAAVVDLAPDGDALPISVELGDARGRGARVVLPAAAGRAEVR